MKLSPLHRRVLASLEVLPAGLQDPTAASFLIRSQLKVSDVVTGLLRRSRPNYPTVWDPWILKDDDIYRMYYLKGLPGQTPWWIVSDICGAVSTDLEHWQDLGVLLEPEPRNDWESGRVCAGCTYKENGIYYLFYSASGRELPHLKNEGIGLAVSKDGVHFSRISDRPLLMPQPNDPWYDRSRLSNHFHWRDPYLYKDEETGKYYLFVCASARAKGDYSGCVGVAIADSITGPYELLPPALSIAGDPENWAYYHTERPQIIHQGGKYHLFFSCFKMFFNPNWLATSQQNRITNSSLYWYTSDHITGPYTPIDEKNFIVVGSERTGLYGTNFLQTDDELIAYGWYHRLHTLEVSKTFQVEWDTNNTSINALRIRQNS